MPTDAHRINLLPVTAKARREGQKLIVMLFAGGVAVIALLGFLWFSKGQQISKAKADTDRQKAKNSQLQAEIKKLEYIEGKSKAVTDKEGIVKASWAGDVSWYRFLQDVATTMP